MLESCCQFLLVLPNLVNELNEPDVSNKKLTKKHPLTCMSSKAGSGPERGVFSVILPLHHGKDLEGQV